MTTFALKMVLKNLTAKKHLCSNVFTSYSKHRNPIGPMGGTLGFITERERKCIGLWRLSRSRLETGLPASTCGWRGRCGEPQVTQLGPHAGPTLIQDSAMGKVRPWSG